MSKPGRALVYSRFGQRYPNILGFKQYLLVFGLKQYNLLSKEFSLHRPIFMGPLRGEGHFVNNRFMVVRNLCENRTLKTDYTHALVARALEWYEYLHKELIKYKEEHPDPKT